MAEKRVIPRDKLGVLTKIGQGGQGVVYRAPNVKTKFAESMVYKEYKPAALAEIDFTALAAMPALVEESLSYGQAERLVSVAAWPCAIVEDGDTPTGFVMPAIPEQFFISLSTVKGVSSTTAEFQHLLNAASVLAARDVAIDEAQRYALLREVASGLAFVHKHGVCIGDISPKNLLFSLSPHEAVYFIDCDAVRVNGVSALPQVETPGWAVPAGEELATIYSDTYKLGLLALRLLAGDQDVKNPQYIPAGAPSMVRQIITDTLTNEPEKRPLPEAWTYVLGHAIEDAQHRQLTAAEATTGAALPPPEIPTVKSRPAKTSPPPKPAPKPKPEPNRLSTPYTPPLSTPTRSGSRVGLVIGIAVAVLIAFVVLQFVLAGINRGNSVSTTQATSSADALAPSSSTAVPLDPHQQLSQIAEGDRPFILSQLADRWIPQLSSKRPGVVDEGVVWDDALTLQEHLRLRQQYDAKLLWSGEGWSTFNEPDYWVTVVPVTFAYADGALSWCTSHGFDALHCYAKLVSTTHPVQGSTAHNH